MLGEKDASSALHGAGDDASAILRQRTIAKTAPQAKTALSSVGASTSLYGLENVTGDACLRVFAAAAIVWYHTPGQGPLDFIGGIGLGIFIYLSFLHLAQHDNFWTTVTRRGKQLLIPWAAWWLFYAALSFWRTRGVPPELDLANPILMLLVWPSSHLWYLPFIFVASLGVWLVRTITTTFSSQLKTAAALVSALVLLPLLVFLPELPPGVDQIVKAIPAIGLGLAYTCALSIKCPQLRRLCFVATAGLVAAACMPVWFWGQPSVAIAYMGSSLIMVLYTLRVPRNRFLRQMGGLTLGIYLVHPFINRVLLKFFGVIQPHWFFALTTLALAILMTWGMRRFRYVRMIV